jgi:hypothetical protein
MHYLMYIHYMLRQIVTNNLVGILLRTYSCHTVTNYQLVIWHLYHMIDIVYDLHLNMY